MDASTIILLVACGIFVGVINTYAGAAAVITITMFSLMGLDLGVANGSNRVAVMFQTITMSVLFLRQGLLDWRLGLKLSIPTVAGAICGSEFITRVNTTVFAYMLIAVLLLLLLMLIFDPTRALNEYSVYKKPRPLHYAILFCIGIYGGAFHIGVGYLFLALLIMGMGYNLIQANALKGFIVLCYTIFALSVFAMNGQVNWGYGVVHGIGNFIGAAVATTYAKRMPLGVLRWGLIIFITLTILYLIYDKL